jgi:O-methyltransferase
MLRRMFRSLTAGPAVPVSEHPPPKPPSTAARAKPSYTYCSDGLATIHNADFLRDPLFRESYRLGAESGHRICAPEDLHIEWRVYVCCWAARHAARLEGDFVECGVSTGIVSRAVAHYVAFDTLPKRFWLVDTYDGIPLEQASIEERELAGSKNARHYFDCYESVRTHFSRYANARVVKGRVPDVLPKVATEAVSYLHIDMNIAEPEVAAIRYFWSRLVHGAIVIFDDYASLAHARQKTMLDSFAADLGVVILALPTGQGMLIKG